MYLDGIQRSAAGYSGVSFLCMSIVVTSNLEDVMPNLEVLFIFCAGAESLDWWSGE
jgi:hypothetical protein